MNEWRTFIAEDKEGFLWLLYSVNPNYAILRLRDFGIQTAGVRTLTEEETVLYDDEIEVAMAHKNIAVFAGRW